MTVIDFKFEEQVPVKEAASESVSPKRPSKASVRHIIPEEHARDWSELPKTPDVTAVGSLGGQRLRVLEPFIVVFREEEEQVVVEATEFDEFGFGATQSEALADLQRAITELYFSLDQESGRLGSDLQRVWAKLQQKICRAPGHEGSGV